MRSLGLNYLATLVVMLAVDAVWLGLMGPRLYRPALGDLLAPSFSPLPAILFYMIFVAGLIVLTPGGSLGASAARGALFGLCAYATYDLTNQATLRQWPTYLSLADMAWGTMLTAFAAFVSAWLRQRLA